MRSGTPLRNGLQPLAFGIPLLLTPVAALHAGELPVHTLPVSIEAEGEHYRYRFFMEIQGEELYWTLTQGPELTRIHPEEETGLGGSEDLYVGSSLDNRSYRIDPQNDLLVPVFDAEQTEPPLTYKDVLGKQRRVDEVHVHVAETGDTREIAGREAHGYRVATVTEHTYLEGDANEPYAMMNYGMAWFFEDLPFSPAALQPSPGLFRMAIAPAAPDGLEGYYLDRLVDALEPKGMIAELQFQSFSIDPEQLASLEAQGWELEEGEPVGQAQGSSFRLTMTEFTDGAEPLDYAVLGNPHRVDAATLEYLESPPMMARMLGACPPLPEGIARESLSETMQEHASFRGSVEGFPQGSVLGEASFGSQEDDFFGHGFALTAETYLPSLDRAACLILLRVGAGIPEPGTLQVGAGNAAVEGSLIAYYLVGDVSEPGEIMHVAVGRGVSGEVRLKSIGEEIIYGELEVEGHVTPLNNLSDTREFRVQGEFNARRVWDRVPTTR